MDANRFGEVLRGLLRQVVPSPSTPTTHSNPETDRRSRVGICLRSHWPLLLLLGVLTTYQLWGLPWVPFHPDESTQLYMSADFEQYLRHPTGLSFDPGKQADPRQRYRLLDAPLTRYLLGLGRRLGGLDPLAVDWDWSQDWGQNQRAGALPSPQLLWYGRLMVALLLPLTMVFIYLIGLRVAGKWTGWLAALLLGSHSLVLLHGRRAMAEGALLFGIVLVTWSLIQASRHPWLPGLALAIAFSAKQSSLALAPVALLAAMWPAAGKPPSARRVALGGIQFFLAFIVTALLLNPIYWHQPLQAVTAAWEARQDLLHRQITETGQLAPNQRLNSVGERVLALVANLYLLPPSFAEVGNYLENTAAAEAAYLAIPGHNWLRGLIPGALLLASGLVGLGLGVIQSWRGTEERRQALALLALATLFQAGALLVVVPLPWQRYVIPAVPFTCLWAAVSLGVMLERLPVERWRV